MMGGPLIRMVKILRARCVREMAPQFLPQLPISSNLISASGGNSAFLRYLIELFRQNGKISNAVVETVGQLPFSWDSATHL